MCALARSVAACERQRIKAREFPITTEFLSDDRQSARWPRLNLPHILWWCFIQVGVVLAPFTFSGSALSGFHSLGDASWRAQNGEIIGTPKQPSGGWLVLDRSYLEERRPLFESDSLRGFFRPGYSDPQVVIVRLSPPPEACGAPAS